MGQARKRGSFEERRGRAVQRDEKLSRYVHQVLKNSEPVRTGHPMDLHEIEAWFDADPDAPLVAESLTRDGHLQISYNHHALSRRIRATGLSPADPDYEAVCVLAFQALRRAIEIYAKKATA